jgi:hypothetical protein
MVSALIFALSFAAFGLLVFGERMGLAPQLAGYGVIGTFLAAALAVALASATSRLGHFVIGAARGAGTGLAVLVCCLVIFAMPLVSASGKDPANALIALVLGFMAALIVSPFNPWKRFDLWTGYADIQRTVRDNTRGAMQVVSLAMMVAAILLVTYFFPITVDRFADNGGWARADVSNLALALLGILLLFGGMVGLARAALVLIAIAVVMAAGPFIIERFTRSLVELDASALMPMLLRLKTELPAMVGTIRLGGEAPAGIVGFVLGMLALQPAAPVASRGARIMVIGMGVVLALGLSYVARTNAALLADLVSKAIVGAPPAQWPVFVFDEALKGWLSACGTLPDDAAAAARACGMPSPRTVLPAGSIIVQSGLAAPALALAQGWPIILGFIWGLLLPFVEMIALGFLLLAAASGFAESILVRLLHPGALRSWRLAVTRLSLIALLGMLAFLRDQGLALDPAVFRWALLGTAMMALAAMIAFRLINLARYVQRKRPASGVSAIPAGAAPASDAP